MSSFLYVEGWISNPRSGLCLYLSMQSLITLVEAAKKIGREFSGVTTETLCLAMDGLVRRDDNRLGVRYRFATLTERGAHTFSFQQKSEKIRCQFQRDGHWDSPQRGGPLPEFAMIAVRVYYSEAGLEIAFPNLEALPAASTRRQRTPNRSASTPSPEPSKAAPAPAPLGHSLRFDLHGQEFSFTIPAEELMALALTWTKKGYAS